MSEKSQKLRINEEINTNIDIEESYTDFSLSGSGFVSSRSFISRITDSNKYSVIEKLSKYSNLSNSDVHTTNTAETLEFTGKMNKLCLLGGGGEAKVYLVQLEDLEEIVALKQYELPKSKENTKRIYEKIKKEFKMLAKLDHDNIIQYFCIYRPEKSECSNTLEFGVIMEYMAGGSLEGFLEKEC